MSLRSRSAANVSTARMSSRSRSGKSARISASVIPDAKYSRTSYTVIRRPRMHGFPPLLPGSRVMRFKRFIPSGYLWPGSEVKPRGLASPLATCRHALSPTLPLGECKPTTILGTGIDNEHGLGDSDYSFRPLVPATSRRNWCMGGQAALQGTQEARVRHPWPQRFFGNSDRHTGYAMSSRPRCLASARRSDAIAANSVPNLLTSVHRFGITHHGQGRKRWIFASNDT